MRARVGDRLVVRSNHTDRPVRAGAILEVHGQDGAPPYVVRWTDTGHATLAFPGPDAFVERVEHDPGGGERPAAASPDS